MEKFSGIVAEKNATLLTKTNNLIKQIFLGPRYLQVLDLMQLPRETNNLSNETAIMPGQVPVEPNQVETLETPLVQANPTNPLVAAMSAINGSDVTTPQVNAVKSVPEIPQPVISPTIPIGASEPLVDEPVIAQPTIPVESSTVPLQVDETDSKEVESAIDTQVLNNPQNSIPLEQSTIVGPQPVAGEPQVSEVVPNVPTPAQPMTVFQESLSEIEALRTELNVTFEQMEAKKKELQDRINEIERRIKACAEVFSSSIKSVENQASINNQTVSDAVRTGVESLGLEQTPGMVK